MKKCPSDIWDHETWQGKDRTTRMMRDDKDVDGGMARIQWGMARDGEDNKGHTKVEFNYIYIYSSK